MRILSLVKFRGASTFHFSVYTCSGHISEIIELHCWLASPADIADPSSNACVCGALDKNAHSGSTREFKQYTNAVTIGLSRDMIYEE